MTSISTVSLLVFFLASHLWESPENVRGGCQGSEVPEARSRVFNGYRSRYNGVEHRV
jgi:hypothetical protein